MTRSLRSAAVTVAPLIALLALAACGDVASGTSAARRPRPLARWTSYQRVVRPLDVVALGTRGDVAIVAAAGRLFSLGPAGRVRPFASAYLSPGGEEPYITAPAPGHRGCSFGRGAVYALRLHGGGGVSVVSPRGSVERFATITAPGLIDGIAFDETGAFGYRLLVTINHGANSTLDAVNCRGAVSTLTSQAPRVEGGLAVAPRSFGRFAGQLIASDEKRGRIFAISARGVSSLVADSGLPHGGDIGVESEAFLPSRPSARFLAVLADRLTPGNRHPGDDVLLGLSSGALHAAGARPGDLLVASEAGALSVAVGCGPSGCHVRRVASGPGIAHAEGHIALLAR